MHTPGRRLHPGGADDLLPPVPANAGRARIEVCDPVVSRWICRAKWDKTSFECSADFQRLPREMELALFRLLQEALTNVHRHSESVVARVRLHMDGNHAVLEVQDAGKGLPQKILAESGPIPATGVGLR